MSINSDVAPCTKATQNGFYMSMGSNYKESRRKHINKMLVTLGWQIFLKQDTKISGYIKKSRN